MKKIILIIILAMTFIACSKENKVLKEEIEKAKVFIEKEELSNAIEILSEAVEKYPKEKATEEATELLGQTKLKKQEEKLLEATKLFEEKSYSLAKEVLRTLIVLDDTTSIAEKGKDIEKQIVEIEEIMEFEKYFKEKKYFLARWVLDDSEIVTQKISRDKLNELSKKLDLEIDKELKVLERNFIKTEDKFSGRIQLTHRNVPKYSNQESYINMGIVKTKILSPVLLVSYFGEDWVFFDKILIKIDNRSIETIEINSRKSRSAVHNGVVETADTDLFYGREATVELMVQIMNEKNVDIRFVGSRNSKDFKLKTSQKLAVKESLKYVSLAISKNSEKRTRQNLNTTLLIFSSLEEFGNF